MHLVRHQEAPGYDAPGHAGMQMRRLQGREAGPSDSVWIGLSIIEPGGGTTLSAAGVEKFYLVIEGELQVVAGNGSEHSVAVLRALDSCRIAPGESRRLLNTSIEVCKLLLVMPNA